MNKYHRLVYVQCYIQYQPPKIVRYHFLKEAEIEPSYPLNISGEIAYSEKNVKLIGIDKESK